MYSTQRRRLAAGLDFCVPSARPINLVNKTELNL